MFQIGNIGAVRPIHQSVDFVIFSKEQFRKIGTVLSFDTGDEGALHWVCLADFLPGTSRLAF